MYSEIWQRDGRTSTDPIVTDIDLRLEEQRGLRRAGTDVK
jgi:hypothetical protein